MNECSSVVGLTQNPASGLETKSSISVGFIARWAQDILSQRRRWGCLYACCSHLGPANESENHQSTHKYRVPSIHFHHELLLIGTLGAPFPWPIASATRSTIEGVRLVRRRPGRREAHSRVRSSAEQNNVEERTTDDAIDPSRACPPSGHPPTHASAYTHPLTRSPLFSLARRQAAGAHRQSKGPDHSIHPPVVRP